MTAITAGVRRGYRGWGWGGGGRGGGLSHCPKTVRASLSGIHCTLPQFYIFTFRRYAFSLTQLQVKYLYVIEYPFALVCITCAHAVLNKTAHYKGGGGTPVSYCPKTVCASLSGIPCTLPLLYIYLLSDVMHLV